METIKLTITGLSPLLMHSDRGADPLDPDVQEHKKLTGIRKKTDEIHRAIAKSEWKIGMYYDAKLGPYMPTTNLRSAIVEGGKINKLGTAAKRGTLILTDRAPLLYEGPRDIEKMWDVQSSFVDRRSVVVGTSGRLMRYRPRFNDWSVSFDLVFNPEVLTRDQLLLCAENAGHMVGLGDYRLSCGGFFGRFAVAVRA